MSNLIAALQIFLKYGDPKYPTCCGHDVLMVHCDPSKVSEEDTKELKRLGFFPYTECEECFASYHYGSC